MKANVLSVFALIALVALCPSADTRSPLSRLAKTKSLFRRHFLKTSQQRTEVDNRPARPSTVGKLVGRPAEFIRKHLPVSKAFFNPSDPLHAYPNSVDLFVHTVFQQIATFEINNADAVQRAINVVRSLSVVGILARAAVFLITVAAPAAISFARRSSDDDEHPVDWNYVDHMAQSVINAIQNGLVKYEL